MSIAVKDKPFISDQVFLTPGQYLKDPTLGQDAAKGKPFAKQNRAICVVQGFYVPSSDLKNIYGQNARSEEKKGHIIGVDGTVYSIHAFGPEFKSILRSGGIDPTKDLWIKAYPRTKRKENPEGKDHWISLQVMAIWTPDRVTPVIAAGLTSLASVIGRIKMHTSHGLIVSVYSRPKNRKAEIFDLYLLDQKSLAKDLPLESLCSFDCSLGSEALKVLNCRLVNPPVSQKIPRRIL